MTATSLALHNSILDQLNLSPEGMTFAQIYDRMKANRREFGLEFIRKVTVTVFQLLGENLISCDDIFAEPGNGSVREREVLYKIAHRGKMHLLGLVLLSSAGNILDVAPQGVAGVGGSTDGRADEGQARFAKSVSGGSTTPEMAGSRSVTLGRSVLRDAAVTCHRGQCSPNRASEYQASPADSQISKIADGYPSAIVKGGGETAPAISLPPSQISVVTESVERVMAEANRITVSNRELCDCGKSVTRVCPCGKEVCSAHWYDADGNHTLSEKDGMCSECVSALQLQTWGESRNGIAGQL